MDDEDEQSKKLKRSSTSSAANAEAKRMKFASVDALSELVWSPRNGLSLRCADLSFPGKAKLLFPNFFDAIGGQTNNNMEVHEKSTTSVEDVELRRQDEVNRPLPGIGGSVEEMKPEREEMVVEDNKVEVNDDAESEEGSSKRSLDSPKALGGESGGCQEKPVLNVDSLEATDENDLATPAVGASNAALVACEGKGECLPEDVEEAGTSGSYKRRAVAKGKEKALSDGNFNGGDGDDDDEESFGSVESCNSAGLLLRGKKRAGFEQQLILGSKRLKSLSRECLGSTSKLKQDSSFMNWISNMTKGIWKGNEEDDSPFAALTTKTSDAPNVQVNAIVDQQHLKENRNTGFQSFFQSIYCPKKTTLEDVVEMDSKNDASLQEQCLSTRRGDHFSSSGNEIEIAPVAEHNISSGKVGINQTSEAFSSGNKLEDKELNISLLSLSKSKPNEEEKPCGEADEKVITNRNSGLESLWISRFSSKSSFPQKKDLHERITNDAAKDSTSQKMFKNPNKILPIVSSLRIESSEAMASLFARRIEALKHIMPSGSLTENAEEGQGPICFYCGKKGHRLQECLEVTDTELRDLVQNLSARNGREEASSLCIRCFQLSHWAATCPNAPPHSSGAADRATKHVLASTSGTKLPFRDFEEVPKAVFDAVQVLRLTRTDVLKWINTKKSVSGLEGFFLRLRLGKWEEGLGGTGYHVARIDGTIERQSSSSRKHSESNSSISVKVGGMTCFVESQFISNHDFLEEELKAWWRSAGKSAGRSGGDGIPSAEELSRKIQQRKMLGF
ncbi:unnamed protein product [Microthlaspi erraticum]|uniref:CCHC-type domain-containing protein n=1 Tax=Microthlaspi erraticum TaxID=1685480 RepID=A0A6D2I8T1_9BRAS|nr:unnamed protein product [Microthlaspi erraticum]